jgi:hypothetical protein
MTGWANEPRPHPGGGTWMAWMPLASPQRPAPKRRPVPDCEACGSEPCKRHSYDVLASLGLAPAEPRSPDEFVHDWRPV